MLHPIEAVIPDKRAALRSGMTGRAGENSAQLKVTNSSFSITHWPVTLRQVAR
jgi:hypothetical protein